MRSSSHVVALIYNMCFLVHSSGISMFWVKELGLSTGPQRQSVRLGNTGQPARTWKSWLPAIKGRNYKIKCPFYVFISIVVKALQKQYYLYININYLPQKRNTTFCYLV